MNKLTTTIELFSVHQSFRVRFTMVIKNDDLVSQKYQFKNKGVINKYAYDGNVSLKINPFPFIIIDISTKQDKKEGWNANWSFALNRRELFIMIVKLTNLYKKFKTIENLFYINSYAETESNKEISEYNKEKFIASNKRISVQACVVDDVTSGSSTAKYEGIVMYINNYDFYTYLTYAELEYLLYELRKIDINHLMMDAINTTLLSEKIEADKIKATPKPPIQQPEEEEIIDTKPSIYIPESNIIPEI